MKSLVAITLMTVGLLYAKPTLAPERAGDKDLCGRKYASCHGASGQGKDTVAKTFKVDDLGSKEVQAKGDADLRKVILEDPCKMKGIQDIDTKAADDLVY
jgi:hypothetical protein